MSPWGWPPPLRERRQVTVLVRKSRSAFWMIVGVSFFSVGTGLLTIQYPDTFFLLPDAIGAMFIAAGLLALASIRCYWKSRWLGITAGTFLATSAILRGLSVWWDLGWGQAWEVVSIASNPQNVSRLISGGLWIAYGLVLMVAWPGLVHDTSVKVLLDPDDPDNG